MTTRAGAKTQTWKPTLSFFAKGHADAEPTAYLPSFKITWSFHKPPQKIGGPLSLHFITCKMRAPELGFEVEGGGDHLLLRGALVRAFAEAWERLWLRVAATIDTPGFSKPKNSNGFAAGPTNDFALAHAEGELIERGMMLSAWQSMSGWTPLVSFSWRDRLLLALTSRPGWLLRFFVLKTHDGHTTLAVLGQHTMHGSIFDCAYAGVDADRSLALRRLLRSIYRMRLFAETRSVAPGYALPLQAKPMEHQLFYADPARQNIFDFLQSSVAQVGEVNLESINKVSTQILYPAGNLPAVAYATNPDFPALSWGLQSIAGVNPWPHPLA